jgi:hypothetical protein
MAVEVYRDLKFRNLIHYVIKAAGGRPNFGATKLYKVAWFADAKTFLTKGHSITGETYIRREHGPVPSHGEQVRKDLVASGAITQTKGRNDYEGWRFRAITSPDLTVFEGDELPTINYWIKHIDEDHSAASISEQSHDYGWEIAAMYERLPFHAFMADRVRAPNEMELAGARERAKKAGLI